MSLSVNLKQAWAGHAVLRIPALLLTTQAWGQMAAQFWGQCSLECAQLPRDRLQAYSSCSSLRKEVCRTGW